MSAISTRPAPVRLHQLDGLRAVAATLVVFYHLGINSASTTLVLRGHGYAANAITTATTGGVELFFVLSGAVLLRPQLRYGKPFDIFTYLRRRAQRLWPPYLVAWLLAGGVILLTTRHPTWWSRGASLPSFSLLSWLSQLGIVYFGAHYSFAWWSLTVEVLFYALVILVVRGMLRWRPRRNQMLAVWAASFGVAVIAQSLPSSFLPRPLYYLRQLLVYAPCFAGGVLLAGYDLPSRWGRWAMALGTGYCLLAFRWTALNMHAGWGVVCLGLVIVALDEDTAAARWLGRWPVVWLGERSYSLFLLHYTVFTAVCYAVSIVIEGKGIRYYLLTRAIEVPLALVAAMAVFILVEKRFARNLVTAASFWPVRPGRGGARQSVTEAALPASPTGTPGRRL